MLIWREDAMGDIIISIMEDFDLLKIKVEDLTIPMIFNSYPDFNIYPRLNF